MSIFVADRLTENADYYQAQSLELQQRSEALRQRQKDWSVFLRDDKKIAALADKICVATCTTDVMRGVSAEFRKNADQMFKTFEDQVYEKAVGRRIERVIAWTATAVFFSAFVVGATVPHPSMTVKIAMIGAVLTGALGARDKLSPPIHALTKKKFVATNQKDIQNGFRNAVTDVFDQYHETIACNAVLASELSESTTPINFGDAIVTALAETQDTGSIRTIFDRNAGETAQQCVRSPFKPVTVGEGVYPLVR